MYNKINITNNNMKGWLDFLWLEITNKCNLKCVHCYASSGPSEPLYGIMKKDDWSRILYESFNMGCKKVQFIGGEPTLINSVYELTEEAKKLGYKYIEIYTNGTSLNSSNCEKLSENNVRLAISMYGDIADIHDKVTGISGSFNKTLIGIKTALKYNIPIRIGIIETDYNIQNIKSTENLLHDLGISDISIDIQRQFGRADSGEININKDDFLCGNCWNGQLAIDSNGNFFPCIMSRHHILGNIRNTSISNILESDHLSDFRMKIKERHQENGYIANCAPWCEPTCPPSTVCNPNCVPGWNPGPCTPSKPLPCGPTLPCVPKI